MTPMPPFKATAAEIELAHIDIEAVDMRSAGLTYPMIAEHQGCSVRTAQERVKRALVRWYNHDTEETRILEMERLDRATERLMRVIARKSGRVMEYVKEPDGSIARDAKGNPIRVPKLDDDGNPIVYESASDDDRAIRAIEKFVQVSARRASLLGLDQPKRVAAELTVDVDGTITHEGNVNVTVLDAFREYTEVLGDIVEEERFGALGWDVDGDGDGDAITEDEVVDAEVVA